MQNVLNNPHSVDEEYLKNCLLIDELLKPYKKKSEKYKTFESETKDVNDNLDEICRQFELHKKYSNLFCFPLGKYINLKQKNYVK